MSSAGDKPGLHSVKMDWWHACVDALRVLFTVLKGYRLQFAMKPLTFNRVVVSIANGDSVHVLQEEKTLLLEKDAIRVVPPEKVHLGFYSRYFLIPKKGSSFLHPVLDLQVLNKHLRKNTFRMLAHKVLCCSICPNDWFITIDLADAFFHRLKDTSYDALGHIFSEVPEVNGCFATSSSVSQHHTLSFRQPS